MIRHSAQNPCPVCSGSEEAPRGQSSRCHGFISDGEKYCHCSREEYSGGLQINMDSHTYAHILSGSCLCGENHGNINGQHSNRNGNNKPIRKRPTKLVKTWDYRLDNVLKYQVRRMQYTDNEGGKTYHVRCPDGKGGFIYKEIFKHTERILYNVDALNNSDANELVFYPEGEKCVDILSEQGLLATTNSGGAGKFHLGKENHTKPLRKRRVVFLPDNDEQGYKHGQQVAKALNGIAASVKVVTLPNLPPKGDVYDWLQVGNTIEQLKQIATSTPEWKPVEEKPTQISQPSTTSMLFNREAERNVLGAMILNQEALDTASGILESIFFFDQRHQKIFAALKSLHSSNVPVDILMLEDQLERDGQLAFIGGTSYLNESANSITTSANLSYHAEIIIEKYLRRESVKQFTKAIENLNNPEVEYTDILANLEKSRNNIQSKERNKTRHIADGKDELIDRLSDRQVQKSINFGYVLDGYDSGLLEINRHLSGLRKGSLITIAGRTGMGKTSLGLTFAYNVEPQHPVLIISYEMPLEEELERFAQISTELNLKMKLTKEDVKNVFYFMDYKLPDMNIWVIDSRPSLEQLQSITYSFVTEHKGSEPLIIIDYIQMIQQTGSKKPLWEFVGDITKCLKRIALKYKIPVIALSQINREKEKENRKPRLSDLRYSGAIEEDSDSVLLLHSEKPFSEYDEEVIPVEIIQAKHRHGASASYTLGFKKNCTKFVNFYEGEPF